MRSTFGSATGWLLAEDRLGSSGPNDTPSWVTSSHPSLLHFSSSLGVKGVKVAPNVAPNADLPGV